MTEQECDCRCHKKKHVIHCRPCCKKCICGKHIKFIAWQKHLEECKLKYGS